MDAIREAIQSGEVSRDPAINVSICSGPAASGGFRKGYFPVTIDGIKFKVFSSVVARVELDEQEQSIVDQIKRFVDRVDETYVENGKTFYRYTSQSKRVKRNISKAQRLIVLRDMQAQGLLAGKSLEQIRLCFPHGSIAHPSTIMRDLRDLKEITQISKTVQKNLQQA